MKDFSSNETIFSIFVMNYITILQVYFMLLLLKKNGRWSEWTTQFNNLAKYSGEILTTLLFRREWNGF